VNVTELEQPELADPFYIPEARHGPLALSTG